MRGRAQFQKRGGQLYRRATLSVMRLGGVKRAAEDGCTRQRGGKSAGCAVRVVLDRMVERSYDAGDGQCHSWRRECGYWR
jgi:hypothetical protein